MPTTPPDFTAINSDKNPLPNISGVRTKLVRMLGSTGRVALGKGSWVDFAGSERKTFFLYTVDQKNDAIGAGVVEIQGAMELASESTPTQDDTVDTDFKVLATLNAGAPHAVITEPWRYLRAVVTTASTADNEMQVAAHALFP